MKRKKIFVLIFLFVIWCVGICWENVQDGDGDKPQGRSENKREHLRVVHWGLCVWVYVCVYVYVFVYVLCDELV